MNPDMSLVKVWTDVGKGKNVSLLAKIVEQDDKIIRVRYLSKTEEDYRGCNVWRYEDETYDIDHDYITEYLMTDSESDIGYKPIVSDDGAYILIDEDSEYIPSSEDDDSEDDDDDGLEEEDYEEDEPEEDCVSEYEE
jgi:hypothetical protein